MLLYSQYGTLLCGYKLLWLFPIKFILEEPKYCCYARLWWQTQYIHYTLITENFWRSDFIALHWGESLTLYFILSASSSLWLRESVKYPLVASKRTHVNVVTKRFILRSNSHQDLVNAKDNKKSNVSFNNFQPSRAYHSGSAIYLSGCRWTRMILLQECAPQLVSNVSSLIGHIGPGYLPCRSEYNWRHVMNGLLRFLMSASIDDVRGEDHWSKKRL